MFFFEPSYLTDNHVYKSMMQQSDDLDVIHLKDFMNLSTWNRLSELNYLRQSKNFVASFEQTPKSPPKKINKEKTSTD